MAQWVPRTAWKLSNLNKRYGYSFLGVFAKGVGASEVPRGFACRQPSTASEALLKNLYLKGVPFIDVRDPGEAALRPISGSVSLHLHDLVSGACCSILPEDRTSEIVVFASLHQRAVNAYNALKYWGYDNVIVTDVSSVHFL